MGEKKAKPDAAAILYSWLHLSDLHFGQGGATNRADQIIVRNKLLAELGQLEALGLPRPTLVLVTGDIAWSGARGDYERAAEWFAQVASKLDLTGERFRFVPGNHDADLSLEDKDRRLCRLLRGLRAAEKPESIDEALADSDDQQDLAKRFAEYVLFVREFSGRDPRPGGAWSERIEIHPELVLRLIGLNTAWIAKGGKADRRALALGARAIADHLAPTVEGELALLLSHHPFRNGWLRDEQHAEAEARSLGAIHLSGHDHKPRSALELAGSGERYVRIAAGAVHEGAGREGSPARHGYNVAAIVVAPDGALSLCVYPRRWSEVTKRYHTDVENLPEGRSHAEHALGRRIAAAPSAVPTPHDEPRRSLGTRARQAEPLADPALEPYLRTTREHLSCMRLLGYESRHKIKLPLSEIFIDLHAFVGVGAAPEGKLGGGEREESWASTRVDVQGALSLAERHGRDGLVLLGDPGAGKTTLLKYLFLRAVDHGSASLGLPEKLCPVLLRFSALKESDRKLRGLADLLARELGEKFPEAGERLASGEVRVLFLLDGLDELRDEATRAAVCRWLGDELHHWPGSRFVATCRHAAWQREARLSERFAQAAVQGLSQQQVRDFVKRWFEAVERGQDGVDRSPAAVAARAEPAAKALVAELLDSPKAQTFGLRDMARNPLMLSTLCLVHYSGDRLPEKRGELYRKCIGFLLEVWAMQRQGAPALPVEAARQILQPLAWAMHSAQARTFNAVKVRDAIGKVFPEVPGLGLTLDEFLRRVRDDCGLFSGSDLDSYEFLHLSFQEYLAAAHAQQQRAYAKLAEHAAEPFWREAILLSMSLPGVYAPFMESLAERGALAESLELVESCLASVERIDPTPFAAWLAPKNPASVAAGSAEALEIAAVFQLFLRRESPPIAEAARLWVGHADKAIDELARALVRGRQVKEEVSVGAAQGLEMAVDATRRRVATEAGGPSLALVPARFGPGTICADGATGLEWCWVPPGEFWMGSSKDREHLAFDEQAYTDELPPRRVRITRGFWISRHPIANGDYARFMAAEQHAEPAHWTDSRFNAADQPVVGVSWNDARAFARWLRGLGRLPPTWTIDLPTEAEWEYVARGPSAEDEKPRLYPWGSEAPRAELAVFGQDWTKGQPGRIGERPAGAGLFRAEDMAGNVWEWCLDEWSDDYSRLAGATVDPCHLVNKVSDSVDTSVDRPASPAVPRVLRGGSWSVVPRDLRAATRLWYRPGNRDRLIGFRVVCRPVREHVVP